MRRARAILIAGPTASGKSALALRLAERFHGVVVNADASQVYRELRILTARPPPEDEARAPHALYGFVSGAEAYSAGRFMADAAQAIKDAESAGRIPIFAGGTGLYFKALLEGLSPIPPIPQDIRDRWRGEAAARGAAGGLHDELQRRDPVMAARLVPADTQRIVRALEVLDATGQSLAEWQRIKGTPVISARECLRFVVWPERAGLYARCGQRFLGMIGKGAIQEVRALSEYRFDPSLPIMRALGVKPLDDMIRGRINREEAINAAIRQTRQYAKRQLTWFGQNIITWEYQKIEYVENSFDHLCIYINRALTG